MSSRKRLAAQLIVDNEFDIAQQFLEKETTDLIALRWLSLMCRYNDAYDQEKAVIQKLLEIDANNAYGRERKAWHDLPEFERLVPRQQLKLPRNPKQIPAQAILDQLCFVTGGGSDSPYRECLFQLLESLRATILYKDIPIMVLDAGLTDDDKDYITKQFGPVVIKDPGWDVPMDGFEQTSGGGRLRDGLKSCTARPFIPKHFPGYRYYFWLDTDVWVQDERSLDVMIEQAVKDGVSATFHASGTPDFNFSGSWWDRMAEGWIPAEHRAFLQNKKVIAGGAFCLDVTTGLFDHWQKHFEEMFLFAHQAWGPDELSFIYTVHKHLPPKYYLDFRHAYSMNFIGMPIVNDGVLSAVYSAQSIGIIHFCGMTKSQFFFPMVESSVPIDMQANKYGNIPRHMYSIHYRTWPWADKPQIRETLMKEARECLEIQQ